MNDLKDKIAWWIAFMLPKRVALYAFVRVHALSGDAPLIDGEYSRAYELWKTVHKIKKD
jgi:hypothetical protein